MTIKASIFAIGSSLTDWVRLMGIALLLTACQSSVNLPPDAVTSTFWRSLLAGNLDAAKLLVTQDSQDLIEVQTKVYTFEQVGAITLDGDTATVVTVLSQNNKRLSFNTVLLKEEDNWKIDYEQTQINISMIPFQGIVKELQGIGQVVGEQLQQQAPLIEKQLESFSDQLKQILEGVTRSLEQSTTSQKQPQQRPI